MPVDKHNKFQHLFLLFKLLNKITILSSLFQHTIKLNISPVLILSTTC